jgi:hypothetical protein
MVLYVLAALAGIGFGLLQARWTVKLAGSSDQMRHMALPLVLKLLLWAGVMAALALYSTVLLIIFALASGLAMVGASLYLYLKSRGNQYQ